MPYRELATQTNDPEEFLDLKIPILCRLGKHKFLMNDYCKFHARDLGIPVEPTIAPPISKWKRYRPRYSWVNNIYVRFCKRCGIMDENDIHRGIHPPTCVLM